MVKLANSKLWAGIWCGSVFFFLPIYSHHEYFCKTKAALFPVLKHNIV